MACQSAFSAIFEWAPAKHRLFIAIYSGSIQRLVNQGQPYILLRCSTTVHETRSAVLLQLLSAILLGKQQDTIIQSCQGPLPLTENFSIPARSNHSKAPYFQLSDSLRSYCLTCFLITVYLFLSDSSIQPGLYLANSVYPLAVMHTTLTRVAGKCPGWMFPVCDCRAVFNATSVLYKDQLLPDGLIDRAHERDLNLGGSWSLPTPSIQQSQNKVHLFDSHWQKIGSKIGACRPFQKFLPF